MPTLDNKRKSSTRLKRIRRPGGGSRPGFSCPLTEIEWPALRRETGGFMKRIRFATAILLALVPVIAMARDQKKTSTKSAADFVEVFFWSRAIAITGTRASRIAVAKRIRIMKPPVSRLRAGHSISVRGQEKPGRLPPPGLLILFNRVLDFLLLSNVGIRYFVLVSPSFFFAKGVSDHGLQHSRPSSRTSTRDQRHPPHDLAAPGEENDAIRDQDRRCYSDLSQSRPDLPGVIGLKLVFS